jgi:hypothetical protein
MTKKQTSPTPAPRIEQLIAGDFQAAGIAITGGPWTMQQAWLRKPDKAFRPAVVRFAWETDALWVLADLSDDFVTARSTAHNQKLWMLGDVFEIFVARNRTPFYLELHVNPKGHKLHLRLSPEIVRRMKAGEHVFDESQASVSEFDGWVKKGKGGWQVLARVPAAILPNGKPFRPGQKLDISFSRYDAGPKGTPEILSSTSPHKALSYHRRHEWGQIVLQGNSSAVS